MLLYFIFCPCYRTTRHIIISTARGHQAHFPRSAISAHPSSIEHTAYVSFELDEFIISLLNRNSCARSCEAHQR